MRVIVQFVLRAYKRLVSPMLPASCKYTPTCSEYAMEAVERHGVLRGGLMSAWRLLRCNPLAAGGFDPVPGQCTDRTSAAACGCAIEISTLSAARANSRKLEPN